MGRRSFAPTSSRSFHILANSQLRQKRVTYPLLVALDLALLTRYATKDGTDRLGCPDDERGQRGRLSFTHSSSSQGYRVGKVLRVVAAALMRPECSRSRCSIPSSVDLAFSDDRQLGRWRSSSTAS